MNEQTADDWIRPITAIVDALRVHGSFSKVEGFRRRRTRLLAVWVGLNGLGRGVGLGHGWDVVLHPQRLDVCGMYVLSQMQVA